MTLISTHAPYTASPATDRNFLVGAAVLLTFLCCAVFATLASDPAPTVLQTSWLFFP